MKFTFGSGQKPLEGYTIKRGVGKGGFGEVYFAVSDGGKEVGLKLLRGDSDVELRGIAHCLNLKHPNLVSLYDLRTDANGNQWVVMEYVAGEPLHTVLNRHTNGLPPELAKQWFIAICRAVGYLHDHGIVHRDLKPANIFLEEGIIKVGDYGLCKSISSSQRSAQTQSVGTVHYMAPEISTGNYGKQIDIYACGVLFYEMLSGRVPFEGESPGEILMKHLTSTPDLTGLPYEFVPILSKALTKNPAQRYASMAEMAQAVEGMNAPVRAAAPAAAFADAIPKPLLHPQVLPVHSPQAKLVETLPEVVPVVPSLRGQVGELSGSMAMAALVSVLTTVILASVIRHDNWVWISSLYFMTVAVCWAVLIPTKFWTRRLSESWPRRLTLMAIGAGVGMLAMWLDGANISARSLGFPTRSAAMRTDVDLLGVDRGSVATAAGYLSYFALAFGIMRWWKVAERRRKAWFSLFPIMAAAFWSGVLLFLWPWANNQPPYGALALTTAAAVLQWVSPWDPPPLVLPRRVRLKYA